MDRMLLRRALLADADRLLDYLTQRQYLHPHLTIEQALQQAADAAEICPDAVQQAMQWLSLDGQRLIGRLRRTELTQLARSIHRYWRQSARQPA